MFDQEAILMIKKQMKITKKIIELLYLVGATTNATIGDGDS